MGNYNHNHLNWQDRLPDINFKAAITVLCTVEEALDDARGGAATFLLPDSHLMEGRLCTAWLKKRLQKKADLKHYVVDFAGGKRLDEWTLLSELSRHLGYDLPKRSDRDERHPALNRLIRNLIDCLTGSIHRSGSVVILELDLRDWDGVNLQAHFLPWFLEEFWTPLVDTVPTLVARHPHVKFIALIHTPLLAAELPDHICCTHDRFDSKKLLSLPLESWTLPEINRWLYDVAGLTGPPFNRLPEQVDRIAEQVYRRSNGRPRDVRIDLMEQLQQLF